MSHLLRHGRATVLLGTLELTLSSRVLECTAVSFFEGALKVILHTWYEWIGISTAATVGSPPIMSGRRNISKRQTVLTPNASNRQKFVYF